MKKLQVYRDGKWEYVFCYNRLLGIVITKNPKKALLERDLEHFENNFSNAKFRVIGKQGISKSDKVLCDLLEWAKGNRGVKTGNPYGIPEVKAALRYLAEKRGIKDYLGVNTKTD